MNTVHEHGSISKRKRQKSGHKTSVKTKSVGGMLKQESGQNQIAKTAGLYLNEKLDSRDLLPTKNIYIFVASNGGLAQLARTYRLDREGHRFKREFETKYWGISSVG